MSRRGLCVWSVVSILSLFPCFLSGAFADGERATPQQLQGWSEDLDFLATDRENLLERALSRPRPREWVSSFRPVSIEAPENAPRLDADLEVEYAGLQWDKVVVRVLMLVSPQSLQAAAQSTDALEFSVTGQVLRGGEPFETFLYRLRGRSAGQSVPLAFERYLTPGHYVLRLRVEHLASGGVMVAERELAVPQMQKASTNVPEASEAPRRRGASSSSPRETSSKSPRARPSCCARSTPKSIRRIRRLRRGMSGRGSGR